jgi:hypothetical protein
VSDYVMARRPRNRGSIPGRSIDFSLLNRVQTDPWAHPASDPISTGASFPGVKRQGSEDDFTSI